MRDRERERFVKLLGLTRSSNDGEALAALRKCNDVLTQHHLSWADVVAGRCARRVDRDTDLLDDIGRVVNAHRRSDPPSPSRAFAESIRREAYFEQTRRRQRVMARRFRIRKIPLLLRLLFFPLWATAEVLAGVTAPDISPSVRAMKSFAALLVLAVSSVAWLQVINMVAALVEAAADAAVP
jgi:hypothetical protein